MARQSTQLHVSEPKRWPTLCSQPDALKIYKTRRQTGLTAPSPTAAATQMN